MPMLLVAEAMPRMPMAAPLPLPPRPMLSCGVMASRVHEPFQPEGVHAILSDRRDRHGNLAHGLLGGPRRDDDLLDFRRERRWRHGGKDEEWNE